MKVLAELFDQNKVTGLNVIIFSFWIVGSRYMSEWCFVKRSQNKKINYRRLLWTIPVFDIVDPEYPFNGEEVIGKRIRSVWFEVKEEEELKRRIWNRSK